MGSGGFGTNASLHWTIAHSDDPNDNPISGRDPIDPDLIGRGTNSRGAPWNKDHSGFIRVRLRFTGVEGEKKINLLADYLRTLTPSGNDVLDIQVPIIRRTRNEI